MISEPITVYISKGCPYCEKVIAHLEEHDATFQVKNVSEDDDAFKEWKSINPMGTPLTVKGDRQVLGFSAEKLDALI
ncbi:glutaredoxin family protein [Salisediminibacterium selenitireducens]|uniref:Glutaredoxin n=1 Tax=Bacillus selenitireducens (strain ATCC 700615 / DSM 15326 / MLS10) TaxID=439292 RepID=D6XTG5_BACIE|nr:glutaredoxin family protein [Salisediminibacterium selenitireducens]ADH99101.1 glutaredoxin [[Bacillus] selenitireducens MLS10]